MRPPVARNHRGFIRVRWQRQEKQFGRWDDPRAWKRFERWKAGAMGAHVETGAGPSLAGLSRRYLAHAAVYYRHPDGTATPELHAMRRTLDDLIRAVGAGFDPAEFDVRRLRDFRGALIARGLARPVVNQVVNRVCRVFRWAGEEEIVPAEIWHKLKILTPLKRGRTEAPEPPDVPAVPEHVFRATLPLLSVVVRGIAMFQRLTGCRPDEACRVRAIDIDRRGDVWIYSPTCPATGQPRHKLAWRGITRAILIGPQLQELIGPIIERRDPDEFLFRPKDQPRARRKLQPCYRRASYYRAIRRAIDLENERRRRLTEADKRAGRRVEAVELPQWTPLMLRHLALTAAKDQFGWRAAQELAGHSLESTTRGYVEERMPLALDAARRAG